jgi:hypothetical protein
MKQVTFFFLVSYTVFFSIDARAKKTIDNALKFSNDESKKSFCDSRNSAALIKQRFFDTDQRMSFDNGEMGLGGQGICWWHTRFQRNSLYLANFEPSKPKPSTSEAKRIIRDIRQGKDVVSVPGYANLKDFSLDYKDEIVKQLENWQLVDGIVRQAWVQGLRGKSTSAKDMKTQMDEMYERVAVKKQLTYAKVQLPGITAHALLVGEMEKTEDGYTLKVVDSNMASEVQIYNYKNGDDSLKMQPGMLSDVDSFVPYVEFTNEVENMERVIASTCGGFDIESDAPACGKVNSINEDDYSDKYIFHLESQGFDSPELGQDSMLPEGGAGECSSRTISPKYQKYDGKTDYQFQIPRSSGSAQ